MVISYLIFYISNNLIKSINHGEWVRRGPRVPPLNMSQTTQMHRIKCDIDIIY